MTQPLIALYKAYRGGEWFGASLESVRPFVDGVAVVISDVPWCGQNAPPENCTEALMAFKQRHGDLPVSVTNGKWVLQTDQYDAGMYLVRGAFGDHCRVLLVDTDEVWGYPDLWRLLDYAKHHSHAVYQTHLWTYVKQPNWRVMPPEPCAPTVLVDTQKAPKLKGVRGSSIPDRVIVPGVRLHHFSYVRAEEADVRLKFQTSAAGDGIPSRHDWFETVWEWLPHVRNFHPSIGYERCWHELEVVPLEALPEPARPVAQELLKKQTEASDELGPTEGADHIAGVPGQP